MRQAPTESKASGRTSRLLWTAQIILAIVFAGTGLWKFVTPLPAIGSLLPWAVEVPPSFFYATAALDLLGGVGIVVPSWTRIGPQVTRLAALGCALLQVSATVFHLSRDEASSVPFNLLLVALALFVFWGRRQG